MKKRIVSWLLVVAMMLCLLPQLTVEADASAMTTLNTVGEKLANLTKKRCAGPQKFWNVHFGVTQMQSDERRLVFDANGGEHAPLDLVTRAGETVTVPDEYPTRLGYNFLGWATTSDSWDAEYFPGDALAVMDDMTLYAVWGEYMIDTDYYWEYFDVLYPGQGCYFRIRPMETGTYVIQGLDDADAVAILYDALGDQLTQWGDGDASEPFFIQWDLFEGEEYYLWAGFRDTSLTGSLYIQVEKKMEAVVSFDEAGFEEICVTEGTEIRIPDQLPLQFGSNFQGWYCQEHDCYYYPGDQVMVDQSLTMISTWDSDLLFVSSWERYDAPIAYDNMGLFVSLYAEESRQYAMIGMDTRGTWAELYDCDGNLLDFDDNSAGNMQFLISYYLTEGETYYLYVGYDSAETGTIPVYVGREYKITYDANGGYDAPRTQICCMGMEVTLSQEIPWRSGYVFVGWAPWADTSVDLYQPGQTIEAESLYLVAIWEHVCEYELDAYVEPDCTRQGELHYICRFCGDSYVEYQAPLGHSYEAIVVEPTCTEAGYTCHICTGCGDTCITDEVDALGHDYADGECIRCGEKDMRILLGDMNGDGEINARDARLLLRYIAGLTEEGEVNEAAADFNGDGSINARDARALLRAIADLD